MRIRPAMPDTLYKVFKFEEYDEDEESSEVIPEGYRVTSIENMFTGNLCCEITCGNYFRDGAFITEIIDGDRFFNEEFERI